MLSSVRAIVITRPGDPGVLRLREVPDPAFGPEEVLVRVRATALNRADLLQRQGLYPAPAGAPADIPGLEFAGEVERRGERVAGLQVGDRVMGLLGGGGHAERVAVHERLCLNVPPALGWEEAAAVPEAFLTAYDALLGRAGLAAGEVVLLHAAGSGVGTAAAQIAAACGARVIGLSRTPDKRRRLEDLGLDRVLDPAKPDLERAIRDAAGGGVDVVIDLVGAPAFALNVGVLRRRGRLVLLGLMGGACCDVDLATLMLKRLTVVGSVLRSRPLEEKIALVQEFGQRMSRLIAAGRLQPVVDCAIPWHRAAEAHARMERNESFGKIVLTLCEGG
jgi:putative PIG3 family NAD(P)H quinone oxidoreductase